jgi:hypothetical protein
MAIKSRTEAHDNSFITKLYRPVDRYVKNLVKQVSDVPKEYVHDVGVSDRAKYSHGADQAAAKREIAARAGRPNQVKEALGAVVGKTPKKGKK